jgi:hypothetical protein
VRRIGFGFGAALAVVAAATLVAQLFSLLANGAYVPVSLGSIWYAAHANSLVGLQAAIENRVSPSLWPPVFWLLQLPAWLVAGLLALPLLLAGRGAKRRGFD